MNAFANYTALSFDCYGTLIDWEAGLAAELQPWATRHGVDATFDDLLEAFGRYETLVQQGTPGMLYPEVLAVSLRDLSAEYGVSSSAAELAEFGSSVARWPAFPDSAAALALLQTRFKLIVLSNIDRASFATSQPKLGVEFDLVVTAQDVGAYKPSAASFPALLEAVGALGVTKPELLHVAQSLYHDHVPAKAAGLATVWINRRHDRPGLGATPPAGDVQPDWTFNSLAEFADAATEA